MTGLVGWWPLHETSGDTAYDLSGNGNHGSVTGASQGVAGRLGLTGYSFDGEGDYVSTNWNGPVGSFTVAAWVRYVGDGSRKHIAAQHYEDGEPRWIFGIEPGEELYSMISDGSEGETIDGDISGSEGEWINVVFVFDNEQGKLIQYKDGEMIKSGSNSAMDYSSQSPLDFYIGSRETGDRYFNGQINDLRVYNRAISPLEVMELYHMGSRDLHKKSLSDGTDSGAVNRWKLEDGGADGSTAVDSWGSNDGSIEGASFTDDSVRNDGRALFFTEDSDDFIDLGSFDFPDQQFTLSAWGKIDGEGSGREPILSAGDHDEQVTFYPRTESSPTIIRVHVDTENGTNREDFIVGDKYDLIGNWMLYLLVFDQNEMKVYVNGNLIDEREIENSGEIVVDDNLWIGKYDTSSRNWNGLLDDVRIYDRALEPWEVFELYRWGSLGKDMRKQLVNAKRGGQ